MLVCVVLGFSVWFLMLVFFFSVLLSFLFSEAHVSYAQVVLEELDKPGYLKTEKSIKAWGEGPFD